MFKRKKLWLSGIALLFIGLLLLAVILESEHFIYIASMLPIFMVLLLPDIRQDQYVRAKGTNDIQLYQQQIGEEPMLMIAFQPGSIRWNNRRLYFRFEEMASAPLIPRTPSTASLAVLPYDLVPHPKKPGWMGIELRQLVERTSGLPYSTEEIARMTIRVSDLELAALHMANPSKGAASAQAGKKSLQA